MPRFSGCQAAFEQVIDDEAEHDLVTLIERLILQSGDAPIRL